MALQEIQMIPRAGGGGGASPVTGGVDGAPILPVVPQVPGPSGSVRVHLVGDNMYAVLGQSDPRCV